MHRYSDALRLIGIIVLLLVLESLWYHADIYNPLITQNQVRLLRTHSYLWNYHERNGSLPTTEQWPAFLNETFTPDYLESHQDQFYYEGDGEHFLLALKRPGATVDSGLLTRLSSLVSVDDRIAYLNRNYRSKFHTLWSDFVTDDDNPLGTRISFAPPPGTERVRYKELSPYFQQLNQPSRYRTIHDGT